MPRGKKGGTASFDKLFEDDDDAFFEEWAMARKKALETHQGVDPHIVVLGFLKTTRIPYAIIGGKAAAFHISRMPPSKDASNLMKLAVNTSDYDVCVSQDNAKEFLDALQHKLRKEANTTLDEQRFQGEHVEIILMGVKKSMMLDSVVDVHVVPPTKMPRKLEKDENGLKYASRGWICKELAYSMKYHASHDEMTKALKRQVRHELLQCEALESTSSPTTRKSLSKN